MVFAWQPFFRSADTRTPFGTQSQSLHCAIIDKGQNTAQPAPAGLSIQA